MGAVVRARRDKRFSNRFAVTLMGDPIPSGGLSAGASPTGEPGAKNAAAFFVYRLGVGSGAVGVPRAQAGGMTYRVAYERPAGRE